MAELPATVAHVLRLPIARVKPGDNVRGEDVGDVTELAASIKAIGIQQPLLVVNVGNAYKVLDGHRRLKAARQVGLDWVPAVLRSTTPTEARIQQQLALAGGKDLDPIAWANALHELMFSHNMTREEVARAVGKSPAFVRDRIALRMLTGAEQRDVRSGRMTVGAALLLVQARRAERDGKPTPAPVNRAVSPKERHCRTCTCPGRGTK